MNRKVITLPSVIVCVLIIIISAMAWFFVKKTASVAESVNIYKNGELLEALPLNEDAVFEIKESKMKIKIENGCAFIAESRCRCKTCVNFGKLSASGQSALCLPEKVLIELVGDSEYDAVL